MHVVPFFFKSVQPGRPNISNIKSSVFFRFFRVLFAKFRNSCFIRILFGQTFVQRFIRGSMWQTLKILLNANYTRFIRVPGHYD
jgi:hypothetical protein